MTTTMQKPKDNTTTAFDEHVKHAVRTFQINKTIPENRNREEKYLPSLSQWLKKRIYCYIEPSMSFIGNQITYKAKAGVQDLNGESILYSQITFVGTVTGTRTAKVIRDQKQSAELTLTSDQLSNWRGYAHFILPNREVCVLNFELPTS